MATLRLTECCTYLLNSLSKIRESLFIVFENAVRYNHRGGRISVKSRLSSSNLFELFIENTGLGISSGEKEKIGTALFYRGEYARKAYPIGMGVGLSVVKAMIKAHKGVFKITSNGPGFGAEVYIALPINPDFPS